MFPFLVIYLLLIKLANLDTAKSKMGRSEVMVTNWSNHNHLVFESGKLGAVE
jgi:hypothetical protein